MSTKAMRGVALLVLLAASFACGPFPTSPQLPDGTRPSAGQPHSFDGTYYHQGLRFGFRVTGNQGIATVSNSREYKPGDVMLRFTPTGPRSFSGEQLCADGIFHAVGGTLADDGSLDMTIRDCYPNRYKMVRLAPAPASQSGVPPAPPPTASAPTEGRPPPVPLPRLSPSAMRTAAYAYQFALLSQAVYEVPPRRSVE